jgi:phosphoglycerate dehydrogenase-like enzyme
MRILIASPVDGDALAELRARHDVVEAIGAAEPLLTEAVRDREALVFRSGVSISRDVLDAGRDLRLLVRAGSGLDNLDIDYVKARGIELRRIPGPGAQAVAELTIGLMLALSRRIVEADALWRKGRWAKSDLVGSNLAGKTIGIVGVGSIGSRVAQLTRALGMTTVGTVEHLSGTRAAAFADRGVVLMPLDEVLAAADFVTLHVPLNSTTRGLIGRRELGLMRPGSFLVNIARGGVVDEDALREALTSGHLRGAALDTHVNEGDGKVPPLADLPNVVLTPHIGASSEDAQRDIGREVVRIVDSWTAVPAAAEVKESSAR